MFRRQGNGSVQGVLPGLHGLMGQAKDEIQVDVVKPSPAGGIEGPVHIGHIVDASQEGQFLGLEALHAHAQAVHPQAAQIRKTGLIHRARVGLAGDLAAGQQREAAREWRPKICGQLGRRQHRRRAPADESGPEGAVVQPLVPSPAISTTRASA